LDDGAQPGYAELKKSGEIVFDAGDVVALLPEGIHSVDNETSGITLSLHVYGKHLNYTGRSKFDPVLNIETPFILKEQ
jgi:predicted metal-dependent enzyme (double-stranded beta helix superfamily)